MFWLGIIAVIAAVLVFCGSVWLVLSMYVGRMLAYFIVASITLASLLILSTVWSFVQLGPVGTLPSWIPIGVAPEASQTGFPPAKSYPNGNWTKPTTEDTELTTELSNTGTDMLTSAIGSGKIKTFATAADAAPDLESARFLEQNGTEYGAITFNPVKPSANGSAVAVMRYDPGNPLGTARLICLGTLLLLIAHLAVLWTIERRAARAAGKDIL